MQLKYKQGICLRICFADQNSQDPGEQHAHVLTVAV